MNDETLDQDLDELLGRHLRSRLDGQLGRAAAAFGEELHARRRRRAWVAAGAAIAACLAIAWATLAHRPVPREIVDADTRPVPAVEEPFTPIVRSATWSRMVHDGSGVIDDQPVRRMSRTVVEEVEWFDAEDGATVRTTLPRQQFFLIGMEAD